MEKVPTLEHGTEVEQSEGSQKEDEVPIEVAQEPIQHIHAKTLILLAVCPHAKLEPAPLRG